MPQETIIVWFRQDLRLSDNPALTAAIETGKPILPVFLRKAIDFKDWPLGGTSQWWLHHSLTALQKDLQVLGSDLWISDGSVIATLEKLIEQTDAQSLYFNRAYEPEALALEATVKAHFEQQKSLTVKSFQANLLFEPWTITKQDGSPYKVYSAFWKACQPFLGNLTPLPAPKKLPDLPIKLPKRQTIKDLNLLPKLDWEDAFPESWTPGEAGAQKQLQRFANEVVLTYATGRNRPDQLGTSRLSPYLHFGEISPKQICAMLQKQHGDAKKNYRKDDVSKYIAEIGWREFAYYLLYHFPFTTRDPLNKAYESFPWADNPKMLKAWQKGQTGYPIIDAGMRELWMTGWMHNRVRMIVGSFLVKDLLLPWQSGAEWFWDTLVDADLASNTMGWQWIAGCGADAAPYFRVFNPILQGLKFDPEGDYVRKWVPEVAKLSNKYIHKPWEAPPLELHQAGVILGETYPRPVVDHFEARDKALDAFQQIRKKTEVPV